MAYVNGQPIAMSDLHDLLVRGYGLPIAQQLIANELARQAARNKGVSATEEEVQREHEMTLEQTFAQAENARQREQMLDQLLAERSITRGQWMLIMRRNALLRKLVPPQMQVTEAELREEFGRQYDRKAVIRHIEVASLSEAQKVRQLAEKEDFARLVQKHSIHASRANGGLLPPIGASTAQVSPAMRDAALALKTVGELSDPVQTGMTFHILRLEEIVEPKEAKLADVRDKITASLKERKVRVFQNQMLARMIQEAKIEYVNPALKAQADRLAAPPKP